MESTARFVFDTIYRPLIVLLAIVWSLSSPLHALAASDNPTPNPSPTTVPTKTVHVPMKLSTEFLRRALKEAVFPEDESQVTVYTDGVGCNFLRLQEGKLSIVDQTIRLTAPSTARVGRELSSTRCLVAMDFKGISQLDVRAVLSSDGRTIKFVVTDSQLFENNKRSSLTHRAVWSLVKHHVHPRIEQLQIDLTQTVTDLRSVIALFVHSKDREALDPLLDSIRLNDLAVDPTGLETTLQLVTPVSNDTAEAPAEPVLSTQEVTQWAEKSRAFDAFLTAIVKSLAGSTETPALKDALLDVLIQARYAMDEALVENNEPTTSTDPIRQLFVNVWNRLVPVLTEIGKEQNTSTSLRFLAFIAAGDALTALDELGPSTGLEISTPGLRRLARVLITDDDSLPQPGEPSRAVDPDLRERLLMGPVPTVHNGSDTAQSDHAFLDWLVSSAIAQSTASSGAAPTLQGSTNTLDLWAPTAKDASDYLPLVSKMLDTTIERTLRIKPVEETFREVFAPLVLATAWQESCWRQWITTDGKVVPIESSAGAVGLMQVRPSVWRGFYDPDKLNHDIRYNAIAGAEILHLYLTRYAIARKEYTHEGGLNNLARATYAAYNGGPRHLQRYRKIDTKPSLKRIDSAFLGKYEMMYQGKRDAVLRCFGVTSP